MTTIEMTTIERIQAERARHDRVITIDGYTIAYHVADGEVTLADGVFTPAREIIKSQLKYGSRHDCIWDGQSGKIVWSVLADPDNADYRMTNILLHSVAYHYESYPALILTQEDREFIESEIEMVGNSSGSFCSAAYEDDDGIDMCHWHIIGYAFR